MKLNFKSPLLIVALLGLLMGSCETDESNQPVSLPQLQYDSLGKFAATPSASTVVAYGRVLSSGKLATSRGVLWSDDTNNFDFTTAKKVVKAPDGVNTNVGSYNVTLSSLPPAKTVYFRLYAQNMLGTVYSDIQSFISLPLLPKFATTAPAVSNVTSNSATISVSITTTGGEALLKRGIVLDTLSGPVLSRPAAIIVNDPGTGDGLYTLDASGLLPGKKYFVRGFATNRGGTAYSTAGNFLTLP